jgi:5-methylcytosine-specific restriction protein A
MDRYLKLIPAKDLPKSENGYNLCRFCNKEVLPPKKTMCSPECVHQILLRTSNKYLRNCIFQRDKGICSLCNIDTKKIAKDIINADNELKMELIKKYQIPKNRRIWIKKCGGGLWDADHILPVMMGGGCSDLNNLRTLCIICHKEVTKSLKKNKS